VHYDYDLLVIGSGGGAFAGAIRARDLGRTVLMVEHGVPGGTCVNFGCIPSKALLVRSEHAALTGRPTLPEAVAEKDALVGRLRQTKYIDLVDEYGIDFRPGHARLTGPHTVELNGESVTAEAILLAAGARPAIPPIPGLNATGFLTSTEALELGEAPPRLAVLGAGPVGLELGQMLGNFGSQVTFIARREIAPRTEPEVSAGLRAVLEDDGHRVVAPAVTAEVTVESDDKVLRGRAAGEPFELRVDEILVATGRTPNTEGLGLEDIGLQLDGDGAIAVDAAQRTSVPSIYAAGDITDQPRFVYVAAAAGAAAAENALGTGGERLDFTALPQVIFTSPAIAHAGLTEAEASERGIDITTTVLPLDAVPRALVNGDTSGMFKLVAEAGSGRLLGASILAAGAPDVIQSAVLAIERSLTVADLARTWAPYLAMAEGLKLAAQTFTRDVSKLSCCAA
jgi:mercuric reductase